MLVISVKSFNNQNDTKILMIFVPLLLVVFLWGLMKRREWIDAQANSLLRQEIQLLREALTKSEEERSDILLKTFTALLLQGDELSKKLDLL